MKHVSLDVLLSETFISNGNLFPCLLCASCSKAPRHHQGHGNWKLR